jgi:hypothetical protein
MAMQSSDRGETTAAAQVRTGPTPPNPQPITPIKLPNPPDEVQPETPKISSRDAPGG